MCISFLLHLFSSPIFFPWVALEERLDFILIYSNKTKQKKTHQSMLPFLSKSDVFIVIRILCCDITFLSMLLFLLPSNIEQMCLKVLFQVPGEIKKTGTDELDLLSFLLPSTPLPLEDTSSATLDSRKKMLSCLRKVIWKTQKCLQPSFILSDQETVVCD